MIILDESRAEEQARKEAGLARIEQVTHSLARLHLRRSGTNVRHSEEQGTGQKSSDVRPLRLSVGFTLPSGGRCLSRIGFFWSDLAVGVIPVCLGYRQMLEVRAERGLDHFRRVECRWLCVQAGFFVAHPAAQPSALSGGGVPAAAAGEEGARAVHSEGEERAAEATQGSTSQKTIQRLAKEPTGCLFNDGRSWP